MRRLVKSELGDIVRFIYDFCSLTPVYIDSEVAIYKKVLEVDKALANYGKVNEVRIVYGSRYILMEVKS